METKFDLVEELAERLGLQVALFDVTLVGILKMEKRSAGPVEKCLL